jgi:hypothetical protein
MGKSHCFKLAIFRCLTETATNNIERSKGTIIKAENSGTVGVGVGEVEAVSPIAPIIRAISFFIKIILLG